MSVSESSFVGDVAVEASDVHDGRGHTAFAALSVPWFGSLWVSGALWHISRWIAAFLGAYVINDLTDSPRLVQLTGTTLWAPLLIGGVAGGVVADRFDRRTTLLTMLGAIIPGAVLLGVLSATGLLAAWMVYPFLVVVGIGWVGDMTSRRTMVFDVVGERHLDNAMALEGVSLALGMTIGNLIGGSVIEFVGVSAAYLGMAGFLAVAFAVLWRVPPSTPKLGRAGDLRSAGRDLAEGVRLVRRYPVVVSVLGVTIVANGFLFSYFPIVQRLGDRMDVDAALIGLLAGTSGLGMMTGSLIVAKWKPARRGLVYVGGTLTTALLLVPFALTAWYPGAVALLYLASVGAGFFASTQSVLVMVAVPEAVRGRALGLLSMSIGALPVGMIVLGELAERIGAPAAVAASAATGAVLLVLWQWRHPAALRQTT